MMKKRIFVLALTLVSIFGLGSVWAGGNQQETGKPHHIVMAYIGSDQQDMAKVTAAINEASLRDINMTVEFIQMGFGDFSARTQLILSGGTRLILSPYILPMQVI